MTELAHGRVVRVEDFIDGQSRALLRTAWLLTGNWASAEDLVQVALVKAWQRWESIESHAPEVYVRRVLLNAFLKGQRRKWVHEHPVANLPDRPAAGEMDASDLRASIALAMATLPARQRAVVVLRYFNDLSEAETAHVLECSIGNVKSQASRALAKLRCTPGLHSLLEEAPHE